MTYVMANLHGALDRYRAMIEKIGFCEDDVLYVLGDIVDYGEDSMKLLVELSMCGNVFPVAGEHDLLALRMLSGFDKMLKEGSMPDADFAAEMTAWAADGGKVTLEGFRELDADLREGVLDYLSEFALYEEVELDGAQYVLVHAGVAGFDGRTPLEEYEPEAFFVPVSGENRYFEGQTLIVGHVPTAQGRIERRDNVILMDCGVKQGGALGCLCLETGEEYYA